MSSYTFDAVVIGAGPAGCAAAGLIAGRGFRVLAAEEHPRIGAPVQCAGLVSPRTLKAAGIGDGVVINEIKGAYIHSPGGETLAVRSKSAHAFVIDRAGFDRKLAEKAQDAGAEILTGAKACLGKIMPGKVTVKLKRAGGEFAAAASLVIGADGAGSRVARRLGASRPAEVVRMFAAEVELKCPEEDMVHIFLGREVAPGWFAWIIPVDGRRARAGIGVCGADKHPRECFYRLAEARRDIFKGMRVTRYTGGAVPIGLPRRIYGDKTMLVGDAACQTKPISGGGLYLGLRGAELCAKVATKALSRGDLSAENLSGYQRLWEKEMAGEIQAALRHREVFLNMSDREMDSLIRFFNRPLWQYVIARYGDIDYPSLLSGKLSLARPWAEKFLRYRFRKTLDSRAAAQL